MKENERCRHPDCEFRASENPHDTGNCNYSLITGKCRTVGLPERLTLPCNCPRYVPRGKGNGLPHQRALPARQDVRNDAGDGAGRRGGRRPGFDVETALALYRAGATDREIAEALGIAKKTWTSWRQKHTSLPPNPDKHGKGTQFDWKKAEELYRRGLNDCQIARELGCHYNTVWRWRYKHELFPNRRRKTR